MTPAPDPAPEDDAVHLLPTESPPDDVCICGQVQPFALDAKWPGDAPRLPWHVDLSGYRGRLTRDQLLDAFAQAWKLWADVIDIEPTPAGNAAAALIRKHFADIDGPQGTLAWSELANNANTPKQQRYDSGDDWVIADRPTRGIDLVRVACHEIGHVLGLTHDAADADALMRPAYSLSIPRPTERDVQRLVQLGYRRRQRPAPTPTPAPTPAGVVTIDPDRRTVRLPAGWRVES